MKNKKTEKYLVFDIETTGLSPVDNRITCFCAKDEEGNEFKLYDEYEAILLDKIYKLLLIKRDHLLISKNGNLFDIPFIILKGFIWKVDIHSLYKNYFYHFDLQEVTEKRISLNDMATMYAIENKSGTGLNAIKLFKEGKISELLDYCMQDVEITEKVYLKYKELHK